MFDYRKLSQDFSKQLNSFDKRELVKWMKFDQQRDVVSRLIAGEVVRISNSTLQPHRQFDDRERINYEQKDDNYALAA